MRRATRWLGTLFVLTGIGILAWSFVVWRWQDPVIYVLIEREQRALSSQYEQRVAALIGRAHSRGRRTPPRSLDSVRLTGSMLSRGGSQKRPRP